MRHSGHAQQQHVVPRGPAATKQKQGAHHSRHSPRNSVAPSYAPRRLLVRASQTARPADDGTREREVSVQDTVPNTPRDDAAEQSTKKPQKSTRTPPTPPPRAVQNSAAQFHHGPECAENNRATMTAPLKGRADGRVNPLPSPQLQRYPLRSRPATGIIPVMSNTAIGAELLHPQLAGRAMERAPGAHNDNEEPDLAVPTAQKQKDQRRSDLEYNNKDDMNTENGNGASRGLQLPGRNSQGRAAPTKTVLDIDDNEKPGFLPNAVRDFDEGWTDMTLSSPSSYDSPGAVRFRPHRAQSPDTDMNGRDIDHELARSSGASGASSGASGASSGASGANYETDNENNNKENY